MNVALGLKAHSGWAALIVLGGDNDHLEVIDRRRLELVEETWAKQPYHAAEELEVSEARKIVILGIKAAHKHAKKELQLSVKRLEKHGHKIKACAVLVGQPMPDWTVDEILAVHFRMHKAEGVLFREALAQAALECELNLVRVPEKDLNNVATSSLATPLKKLHLQLAALGQEVGPPWTKDQKEATLAAMIALNGRA